MHAIVKRLQIAFDLTLDLAEVLTEEQLGLKLGDLPSNTIGGQLWCVVGARESYLEAIKNEKWVGFSCSLSNPHSIGDVKAALETSSKACMGFFDNQVLSNHQVEWLLLLIEHEVQHHGQLIRYGYGNRLKFPRSWNERYTV